MKSFQLLLLGNLLLSISANCQQKYSLEDCYTAARKNNVAFKKSKNDIQNSYADKKSAVFNLFPSIFVSTEHVFSSGKNIDPVTNNFVKDRFSGGELNMTLQLNIFSGFNAVNAIKSAVYRIKAGESAYEKTELETFSAIAIAYAKAMYNREQVYVMKNNNQNTKKELDETNEKINVGKLSKSDYYTISARYKSEQAELIGIQNDSLAAMDDLKNLLGLDYRTPLDIKDIYSTEIDNILNKKFILAEVLEKVLKNHPAVLEMMFNERAAEMDLRTARGNLLPNISLTGNIFSNYNLTERNFNGGHIPFKSQLDNNFGKTVGVLLEIPLFNKYQNRSAVEKQKINLSNTRLVAKEIENDIVKNTQQLINSFTAAKQKYLLQSASLEQGELAYSAFEDKHKLGYITSLELITAKDQLYGQQVKTTEAKYDLYFKYKLIDILLKR